MRKAYDRLDPIVVPRPNWVGNVREVYEFKTEIFMSEDGHETRYSHRTMPRISIQYQADMVDDAARAVLRDLVIPRASYEFIAPVRWRSFAVAEPVAAASSAMTFPGQAPWWVQENVTLVIEGSSAQEAVYVQSVAQGPESFVLTFTAPTKGAYVARDRVMLGLRTHYEAETGLASVIRSHRQMDPTFLAEPGRLPVIAPGGPTHGAFKGYAIVPGKHNWRDELEVSIDDRRETVDIDRGPIDMVWERDHFFATETRRYTGLGRTQIDDLVQSFMRHRGMREPFWTVWAGLDVPEWSGASEGSKNLFFVGSAMRDTWNDTNPIFNHLWIEWPDGAVQINRIINVGDSFGNSVGQMEDPFERDTDGAKIRFAVMARYGTDRLELEWASAEAAEAQLPVRALRTDWILDDAYKAEGRVEITAIPYPIWTDPEEYHEIDLAAYGANLGLVDAGEASCDLHWKGRVNEERPDTYNVQIRIAFFDGAGAEISSDTRGGEYSKNEGSPRTHEFERTYTVPAGTRFVRSQVFVDRQIDTPTIDFVGVRHADWGRYSTESNLQWL